jgi:hypothetical protein
MKRRKRNDSFSAIRKLPSSASTTLYPSGNIAQMANRKVAEAGGKVVCSLGWSTLGSSSSEFKPGRGMRGKWECYKNSLQSESCSYLSLLAVSKWLFFEV